MGKAAAQAHLLAMPDSRPFMAWYKDAAGRFVAVSQPSPPPSASPRGDNRRPGFGVWPYELAAGYIGDDREIMRTRAGKTVEETIRLAAGGVVEMETTRTPFYNKDEQHEHRHAGLECADRC